MCVFRQSRVCKAAGQCITRSERSKSAAAWNRRMLPLLQPHNFGTPSELKLLRSLIDRCAGSRPPPQMEVETGLESALARLMLLEVRLRKQVSRASGTQPSEQR